MLVNVGNYIKMYIYIKMKYKYFFTLQCKNKTTNIQTKVKIGKQISNYIIILMNVIFVALFTYIQYTKDLLKR